MYTEFGRIEIEDRIAVDKLPAVSILTSDSIDLFSGILSHLDNFAEDFLAAECQITAADIKARHEKIAA